MFRKNPGRIIERRIMSIMDLFRRLFGSETEQHPRGSNGRGGDPKVEMISCEEALAIEKFF